MTNATQPTEGTEAYVIVKRAGPGTKFWTEMDGWSPLISEALVYTGERQREAAEETAGEIGGEVVNTDTLG